MMAFTSNIKIKRNAVEIICYLFILLFVYAAASKFLDYEEFRIQLTQSPLLSAFAGWVAWIVPVLELIVAILLMIKGLKSIGLIASYALMVMFTTYIIIILNFSEFIPCSCGGVISKMSWNQHLIFNLFLVLLAIIGIVLKSLYPLDPAGL